jgi:hypothetical protein
MNAGGAVGAEGDVAEPSARNEGVHRARRRLLKLGSVAGLGLSQGLGLSRPAAAAGLLRVRHELPLEDDGSMSYSLAVLNLLLGKTEASHGPYQLETMPPRDNLTQSRQMLDLRIGTLDVMATMTSKAREADGIPVHTCMRRGLNGLRLPIALASRRRELEAVRDVEVARRLRIGQVAHWPDAAVLKSNGWNMLPIPRLRVFEGMLQRERFDLFALAADEAYGIVNALPGLVVLSDWLIAYPSTYSFIVNHARPELAERLRQGWRIVQADGSFEALHEKFNGAELAQARLASRHWFHLSNPDLPLAALRQDGRLWHPLVRQRVIAPLLR